jgi:hypothetical protein
MRKHLGRVYAVQFLISMMATNVHAQTDATKTARDLFFKGEQAETAKRYEEALEYFRKVLDLKTSAAVWFHIAHCEESLGQLQKAKESYEHAKVEAAGARQPELLNASDAALTAVVKRMPRIGAKCVSKSPCTMTLNRKLFDGLNARVDPGTHVLEATTQGGGYLKREVTVREADIQDLEMVVDDAKRTIPAPGSGTTPVSGTGASASKGASVPAPVATSAPPLQDERKRSLVLPLFLSGIALGLAGAGVVSYITAGNKADEGRAECATLLACDKSKNTVRVWDAIALGAFSGAAVAAGFSVYFFVAPGSAEQRAHLGGTLQW